LKNKRNNSCCFKMMFKTIKAYLENGIDFQLLQNLMRIHRYFSKYKNEILKAGYFFAPTWIAYALQLTST